MFETRRQLVLEEANALGTTWLRAGLFPEPYRTEIRNLLRDYVTVRLEAVQTKKIKEVIEQSEAFHDQIWSQAVAACEKNPGSIVAGLFVQSLNDVIDLHAKRVQAVLRNRIPIVVWAVLYFITILSMVAMGYQSGLTSKRGLVGILMLVLIFSAVAWLIMDLDRPQEGLLKVGQQALVDARNMMISPGH